MVTTSLLLLPLRGKFYLHPLNLGSFWPIVLQRDTVWLLSFSLKGFNISASTFLELLLYKQSQYSLLEGERQFEERKVGPTTLAETLTCVNEAIWDPTRHETKKLSNGAQPKLQIYRILRIYILLLFFKLLNFGVAAIDNWYTFQNFICII